MSPISEYVATEVKVWMARRRMNQGDLGAALGHDQTWVSKRLSGRTAITLDDLDALAQALEVEPVLLLPAATESAATARSNANRHLRRGRRRHLVVVA